LTIFGLFSIASGASLDNIIAYPNPCYMKKDNFVTIPNIPVAGSAVIYIYNVAGELVRKLEDGAGITVVGPNKEARWDGRNSSGKKCASGLYLYLLKTDSGKKTGKIGILW
jgi:hypothetical protein